MQIKGISAVVPRNSINSFDEAILSQFGEETTKKVVNNTGVLNRRIVTSNCCTSDIAVAAAKSLMAKMDIDPTSIEACIFISQTPDYLIPSTSPIIQQKLGLPNSCFTLDVNKGCTGYTDGLIISHGLMQGIGVKRILLLTGDLLSKTLDPADQGSSLLFGDAACATLLESSGNPIFYDYGTDGNGSLAIYQNIGYRYHANNNGNFITAPEDLYLHLSGVDIFNFTIDRVPLMVKNVLTKAEWNNEIVDSFIFHQANAFIINYLSRKLRIPKGKVPLCLDDFGNTSSASIPLTMVTRVNNEISTKPNKLVFIGFGVGLTWSTVAMNCEPITICPLIELDI